MIEYNYEVILVSTENRVMEVIYTSQGRETLRIGTRLPYEGESLEDVIRAYAPVQYWLDQEKVVTTPKVGTTGAISVQLSTPAVLEAPVYEVGSSTVVINV